MASDNLKAKATHGFLWSAIDKFGVRLVQFVFGIILARLLLPADFGMVGMLSVFIGVSQAFIDSGMGSGLIQKQDRTKADYSTVFVFNLVVSTIVYGVLFLTSPLIASFYEQPQLTLLTRVLMLNLLISAFAIVQRTRLTIALDFKSHAKVNVVAALLGGAVGISMAYLGYGVWSLVGQTLAGSIADVFMLWIISKWTPSLYFAKDSFRQLFGYGSRLLAAGMYAKIMQEMYNIIIGKVYSAGDLGYYTRARSFTQMAAQSLTTVINQVSFPILAGLQNDQDRMIRVYRRMIRMSAFLMIPTMVLIAVLAEPIVILLLTEKWQAVIPLLQWLVFARIFYPMSSINLNLLKAVGRSDWFMKVDMAKFPLLIISLIITVPLGIEAIVIGQVVVGFLAYLINTYIPGRHFGYGAVAQLRDMAPFFGMVAIMALITWAVTASIDTFSGKLLVGGIVGALTYGLMAYLFKVGELEELLLVGKQLINKFK